MEEQMTFKHLISTLGLVLLVTFTFAITLDELEQAAMQYYSDVESEVETDEGSDYIFEPAPEELKTQGDAAFIQFMLENNSLDELEEASYLWRMYAQERYDSWIEAVTADASSPLKFFYLWFEHADDELSKINAGRKLAQEYPEQVYGYRLMTKVYFENYPFEDYFDYPDEVNDMLNLDLPLLNSYYQNFSQDTYHQVAGIFYYAYTDQMDLASKILEDAYHNEAKWIKLVELDRLQPIEKWHELLYSYFNLVTEDEDPPFWVHDLSDLVYELASYYFEDTQQYERVIKIVTSDSDYLEDYYLRYILANSYYNTNDLEELYLLLLSDELEDAKNFQSSWLSYKENEAIQVYQAALENKKDKRAIFLMARIEKDKSNTLKIARTMIKEEPRSIDGYELLADIYLDYFGSAAADDAERSTWLNNLKKDKGQISSFYIRFPKEQKAQTAVLLSRLIDKNVQSVKNLYSILLNDNPFSQELKIVDKLLCDEKMYDLLWETKSSYIDKLIEKGVLDADDEDRYFAVAYASVFYSAALFEELIDAVKEHPEWIEYEDIQYMMVNSNYHLKNYASAIEILYYMLEEGTIGYEELISLEDTPLSDEPTWPDLVNFAAEQDGLDIEPYEKQEFEPYPAPEWSLSDAEGKIFSLSGYRGQIVIIDFWATWCGPCQRSMPLLNEWMQTQMPEGVQVFSINVWENNPEGAIKYMTENKFEMQLLFGTEDITTEYKVEGIPYIAVVDQEGMVRFTEIGYSQNLKEKLTEWVTELQ